MPSKYANAQIRYLDLLKENNLLDMAISGKLPQHVEQAAKQVVVLEMAGDKANETKTVLHCTAQEHDEAQREIDGYLRHYNLMREVRKATAKPLPRFLRKGARYVVRNGYFKGRTVTYKGTDLEVFGCEWLETQMVPACEKYVFRAQQDRLSVSNQALVFSLNGENRDVILQAQEIGLEVQ